MIVSLENIAEFNEETIKLVEEKIKARKEKKKQIRKQMAAYGILPNSSVFTKEDQDMAKLNARRIQGLPKSMELLRKRARTEVPQNNARPTTTGRRAASASPKRSPKQRYRSKDDEDEDVEAEEVEEVEAKTPFEVKSIKLDGIFPESDDLESKKSEKGKKDKKKKKKKIKEKKEEATTDNEQKTQLPLIDPSPVATKAATSFAQVHKKKAAGSRLASRAQSVILPPIVNVGEGVLVTPEKPKKISSRSNKYKSRDDFASQGKAQSQDIESWNFMSRAKMLMEGQIPEDITEGEKIWLKAMEVIPSLK